MDNVKKTLNATTVTVFIIAFLLGYGTSSRIVNRDQGGEPAPQETAENKEVQPELSLAQISATLGDQTSLVAADDQPAGEAVAVAVKIQKEAWAAVHEDASGKPGKILGAQFFPAGNHLGKVTLLRATEAGKKHYVMLHTDDGDRAFDYQKDMPLKDAAGKTIMDVFTATAGAVAQ